MLYEQTKKLSNREFKRLVGVQRLTFDQMVKVMGDTTETKQTRGCRPKLDLEDQVLICLQYWRGAGDAPPPENIALTSILLKIGRCQNRLFAVSYTELKTYWSVLVSFV